ncbi:TraB domain-containing protein [Halobium salinum]|uniref:TraB domain-containing protein n=1 Tax=Halobium salinum TaxID=1364940 RepID=A0ABD5PFD9_9EURY|nr:TraB domain-containing protein [Halobium salinum]
MFDRFRGRPGSVRLVGTAHVSPRSRERVVDVIRAEQPDTVAIELDADRFTRLWRDDGSRLRDLLGSDLSPAATLLALVFSVRQRRLAREMGVEPGEADMLPAARTGREVGATVTLVDSSSTDAFDELTARCLSTDAVRSLVRRVGDGETRAEMRAAMEEMEELDRTYDLSSGSVEAQVEALETMPLADLDRLVDATGTLLPTVANVLLTERNRYMAGRLHWLREEGEETVAVVGRAHVPGLQALLDDPDSIPTEHVTEPRSVRFVGG